MARIWNLLKFQNISPKHGRATERTVIESSLTQKKKLFQNNEYWERYPWFSGHRSKLEAVRNHLIFTIAPGTSQIWFGWIQGTQKAYIIAYLGTVTRKVKNRTDGLRSEIANRWVLRHEKVARIWNLLKFQNISPKHGRATERTVIESSFTRKKNYSKITNIERDIHDLVGIGQNWKQYATTWFSHIAPGTSQIWFGWIQGTQKAYIIAYLGTVTRKVKNRTDGLRSEIANRWVLGHEKVARIWNLLKFQNISPKHGRATERTVIESSLTQKKNYSKITNIEKDIRDLVGIGQNWKQYATTWFSHIAPGTSQIWFGWIQGTQKAYIIAYLGSVTRKVKNRTDGLRSEIANRWVLGHEKVARIWNLLKFQNISPKHGRATERTVIESSLTQAKKIIPK